jgi:alkylated DNA repair dioxygenase AlkB
MSCFAICIEMEMTARDSMPKRSRGLVIASLSLGAERLYRLERMNGRLAFAGKIAHGRLLVIAGKRK